jgi:nitrate reductase NapAB chaperone NapD
MTISALVLTVTAGELDAVQRRLAADPRLTIGAAVDHRLPVVVETADCTAAELLYDWLRALAGVSRVDVVLVDFSEESSRGA